MVILQIPPVPTGSNQNSSSYEGVAAEKTVPEAQSTFNQNPGAFQGMASKAAPEANEGCLHHTEACEGPLDKESEKQGASCCCESTGTLSFCLVYFMFTPPYKTVERMYFWQESAQ